MILLSGVCVLVSLGLLIAGLASGTSGQVYLSICASLAGAVLVGGGVHQRRPADDRAGPGRSEV